MIVIIEHVAGSSWFQRIKHSVVLDVPEAPHRINRRCFVSETWLCSICQRDTRIATQRCISGNHPKWLHTFARISLFHHTSEMLDMKATCVHNFKRTGTINRIQEAGHSILCNTIN
jgi:hypothetical protein